MKKHLCVVFALFCCLLLTACGGGDDHTGEAKTPSAARHQEGRHYEEVVADFEERGFTNIQTDIIDDLVFGWLTDDGEVEQVTVGGDQDYSADVWYPNDVEVVITYHTFPSEDSSETTPNDESATAPTTSESLEELQTEDTVSVNPAEDNMVERPVSPPADSTFSIRFIDVGQADAALVECDGHYMLIDGGNKEDSSLMYSVLKTSGISKLDIVVGTHAHEDHIGGLPGALNYATADMILCPVTSYDSDAFNDFAKYATSNGGGITIPNVGNKYSLGSASINILGVNGDSDINNTSIVLKITYGQTSFLFTGDAEREAEQAILNSGADLSATVLKVGHHGSDTSTTYPFLREIMPQYAVISVGTGNSYGHPTEDTLSRLRDADVTLYRTDLQGDIICTSDGSTVSFSVERNAGADTLAPAQSKPATSTQSPAPAPAPVVPTPAPEPDTSASEEPIGTDYIMNTNTKKFHYPSCGSVAKMKDKNKGYFTGTRDELIAQGYDPCGNCHP